MIENIPVSSMTLRDPTLDFVGIGFEFFHSRHVSMSSDGRGSF